MGSCFLLYQCTNTLSKTIAIYLLFIFMLLVLVLLLFLFFYLFRTPLEIIVMNRAS